MKTGITVVIPAFNARTYIGRALDSVLYQTLKPDEVIVVDDGSTDDTADLAIAHRIREHMPVRVIRTPNAGVSAARNTGIVAAQTNHVAFLDADDEHTMHHIQAACAAIDAYPSAVAYWAGITRVFDNDSAACRAEVDRLPDFGAIARRHAVEDLGANRYRLGASLFNDLIRGNFIQPSAAVVKRETAGRLNLFNGRVSFAEDRLFFLELLGKGAGIFTDLPTARVHRDGSNTSVTTDRATAVRNNARVLLALEQAKSIPSIAEHPQRRAILQECLETALRLGIYYSSYTGLRQTASAVLQARRGRALRLRRDPVFLAKNLGRSLASSLRSTVR